MAKKGAVVEWKDVILCVIQYLINKDEFNSSNLPEHSVVSSYHREIKITAKKDDTMAAF